MSFRSLVLDLLGSMRSKRLEGALVGDRGHRSPECCFVRLGPLLTRHQDVLLALGFFDLCR